MVIDKNSQLSTASAAGVATHPTQQTLQTHQYIADVTRPIHDNRPTVFSRLFPSVQQRLINDIQRDVLQVNGQLYVDSVKAMGQCALQALQEDLNDRLLRWAATIRTETIKVANAKLAEVSEELSRQQQRLIVQIEQDIAFCKTIKSEFLRKKYEEAIVRHTDEVFEMFAKLSNHFSTFLDAKIGAA